jgi:heat-inducible transcriptional repressor
MTSLAGHSSHARLPERSRLILSALVQQYIEKGEPVSSLWLAQHGGFGLSSATVRNTLSTLEDRGYVHHPHPSAGRVPTDLGYRAYVDLILDSNPRTDVTQDVEARLRQAGSVSDVLSNVSHELSRASHNLGFAMIPPIDGTFRYIEFVPQNETKILVVVETDTGQTEHKLVDLGEAVPRSELEQGANYLMAEFSGLPLWDVRATISEQLRQEQMLYDELLSRALRLASSTLEDMVKPDQLFLEGAGFLLDEATDTDGDDRVQFSTLRSLLSMIERKEKLVRLLNEYIEGRGLTVVIGTEHSSPEMKDFSLVMSTYVNGSATRSVGVIGPRRMRYSQAISAVNSISVAIGRVLISQSS